MKNRMRMVTHITADGRHFDGDNTGRGTTGPIDSSNRAISGRVLEYTPSKTGSTRVLICEKLQPVFVIRRSIHFVESMTTDSALVDH
jgi:hypothetical protein